MDFQAVKGTRDFYPDAMRVRTYITDAWRAVSLRNGFEEYDAPIFEYLDLFTIKSGQEIAEQLFSLTDRGGRNLAIRPEITPSLARMVNARIGSLPRPIKWFSMPRVCRAENPQRGRLREFFQWNVDVIGSDDVLADAECIFAAVDLLRELKLTADDVVVRIGHRGLTTAMLAEAGVPPESNPRVLAALDKRPKVPPEAFEKLARDAGLDDRQIERVCRFQDAASIEEIRSLCGDSTPVAAMTEQLQRLLGQLAVMGVAEFCKLDMRIVRGLAYYTGVVYEIFDRAESLRAVAGGGRYDNLLEVLGGPAVGATGFGMGDVVLGILLEDKGKLPAELQGGALDVFVIDADASRLDDVLALVAELRGRGVRADFSYKRTGIGKQLREATRRQAAVAVIVEPDGQTFSLKDLAAGEQTKMTRAQLLERLCR